VQALGEREPTVAEEQDEIDQPVGIADAHNHRAATRPYTRDNDSSPHTFIKQDGSATPSAAMRQVPHRPARVLAAVEAWQARRRRSTAGSRRERPSTGCESQPDRAKGRPGWRPQLLLIRGHLIAGDVVL
jgi:hypothetical protein